MFGTMDFGHSDIWHFNFPLKFFLSETLKSGYLPLWSKNLGTGFPLLAEGQIGMFNIFNLFLFKFFTPVTAFNLSFIIIFLTTATGTYLFVRTLKLGRVPSLSAAIIFSLSGIFVTHIVHFNLIQALSFLPWLFYLAQTKRRWLFSLVLALQIYSGFQQVVLITLIGLLFYRRLPILATIFGFLLASPQLLFSAQLIHNSYRASGVPLSEMVKYPFPPVHFLSFFDPYIFGSPANGTYPKFGLNWGIFWESTGYLGILPLILALISLKNFRKNLVFWIILGVSLILLLGKYTPFFFLYQLPPLNMFRVPARFLVLFCWSLVILSAIGLNSLKNKKLLYLLAVAEIINILLFAWKYNPIISSQKWLEPPETVKLLKRDQSWFRVSSLFPFFRWNKIFFKEGWQKPDDFLLLRSSLDPNQNLFWNISSADVYAGLLPKRLESWEFLVNQGITINSWEKKVSVSSSSAKLLSLAGVKYLISPFPVDGFSLVATPSANPQILLYQNKNASSHAYLTRNYLVAKTIPDLLAKVANPEISAVILEKQINLASGSGEEKAIVIKNNDLEVDIKTESSQAALLVLSDSFYPGWKAFLDNQPVEILPANLNQRAIIVSPGSHLVHFVFQPFSPDNILSSLRL